MFSVRRHIYAVALIYNLSLALDSKFKASLCNISNLQVLVAVEIAFRALLKRNLTHEKLVRVA
jgi:hypothetical protein